MGTEEQQRCGQRCQRMTDRGLCESCARRLKSHLIELETIYVGLSLERGRPGTQVKVSGTKEPPVPVRLGVLSWLGPASTGQVHDDYDDNDTGAPPLLGVLGSWARMIAEERKLAERRIDNVITFLLRNHAWSVEQFWADDYAEEIAQQVYVGRSLGGTWRLVHRLDAPCPRCSVCALTRADGEEWVNCESCGAGWDHAHYESLTRTLAAALSEAS